MGPEIKVITKILRKGLRFNYNQYIQCGHQRHLWYFIHLVQDMVNLINFYLVRKINTQMIYQKEYDKYNYRAVHCLLWRLREKS